MKYSIFAMTLSASAMLAGCATTQGESAEGVAPTSATAVLLAADGSSRGEARVTEASDGLHVMVDAKGLTPGMHAVHVHGTGNCTPPDFTSAGGHWNPSGRQHGRDNPAGMHMGDMPNMIAGADGSGQMEYVIPGARLGSGGMPMLDADGAAIVIHAQADDNRSDPAGNAGGRVACGVISGG
ncbi:superoxide dismutase family protein [Sphingobium vermicomposti]|uniref:Superoxide dismutase [Cu-Zn] n=1 Tax=Sphingobium vermicomposti TaxID=529005 RepID=A0A846M7G9_9SPHN|nr:superoxide dismutase family protein [Sphingobium vermicomposti]NIJ17118.1 Cu-Zn family superoxide dismutase [Sphingobium vermicomposti]